jgi:hypothetical protein
MAENLFGDTAFPDYSKNINDFFSRIRRVAGRASQQAQSAQVNPYGSTMRGATPAPVSGTPGRTSVTDDYMYNRISSMQPEVDTTSATPAPRMGGGAPANPIDALFAPMFENLRKQRQQANKRYEANKDQVTNIYGQITGARSQDVAATETAFKRLIDAASARSTAVNAGIDTAEAQRLQQNQAALQGLGLEGLSTSQGDIASQTAAQAKQTNALNAANWQDMLGAMGATAGQQVQADIAGYNYAKLEDLGRLRGAREEFAQELGQQRGELKSKKAQANFDYQQAQQRAAAAAKEAKQRARAEMASAEQKAQDEALAGTGRAVPLVNNFVKTGLLAPESGTKVLDFMTEFWTNAQLPAGATKWTTSSAKTAALAAGKDYLTSQEKTVIQAIIDATVSK